MNNLIERYLDDVVRRLPEREREEVRRELEANIYDMLPQDPGQDEIESVLEGLGSPAGLAEQYRKTPRYLISPAVYDDYVRALRWLMPLVGTITLIAGMIVGAVQAVGQGEAEMSYLITQIVSQGISLGAAGLIQVLLWTTVGFVISERINSNSLEVKEEWKISDLPVAVGEDKGRISMSDSIAELAIIVFLSGLMLLYCTGIVDVPFMRIRGVNFSSTIFSGEFLAAAVPVIILAAGLGVAMSIAKIVCRRWTLPICAASIVSGLIQMILFVTLINRPNLFDSAFTAFIEESDISLFSFAGGNGVNAIIYGISAIIIVVTIAECIFFIHKILKYNVHSAA